MCAFTSKKSLATKFSISSSRRTTSPSTGVARVPRITRPDSRHYGPDRVSAGHINAIQPVRSRSRQRRDAQRHEVAVRPKPVDSTLTACGLRSFIRQRRTCWRWQEAGDNPALHQPEAALRDPVAGVNNFTGLMQKRLITLSCLVTEGRG